ncbi:MAG: CRISPR-associated endonuclease Cas3'' [Clostridiales bacterium]|jgi:CRISPR-associated endonuclease/helicase Cas3|nr:CRISPR-associated endonuclease Cas3'' [Eubacteriales bacterium]MDH7565869.1 CRISPR-associated endonuclease Cas3'' [Clostridiales bacterium]
MQDEHADIHANIKKQFIAHRREADGKTQDLWQHLKETSSLAGRFATKIGLEKPGELIGLLHDLGKATQEFDQYIRSAVGLDDPDGDDSIDISRQKGKPDHSSAGAQVIHRYFSDKGNESLFVSQILALTIASHHSGLIDCLTPEGEDNFSRRIKKSEEKTRTKESLVNLEKDIKSKVEELLSDHS